MTGILKNFGIVVLITTIVNCAGALILSQKLAIPSDTENFYSPAALSLAAGHGYTINEEFVYRYPPLYPIFLAAIYSITGIAGFQNPFYPFIIAMIQAFSCGFLYLIARHMNFSQRTAVLSAASFTLYPFFLLLGTTRYAWSAMPLFIFMFYTAVLLFLKSLKNFNLPLIFLSGILMGLAALTWPGGIYAWVVCSLCGAWYAIKERKILKGTLLFLCLALGFWIAVFPWNHMIYKKTNQRVMLSSGQMLSVRDGLLRQDGEKFDSFELVQRARVERSHGGLNDLKAVAFFIKSNSHSIHSQQSNF